MSARFPIGGPAVLVGAGILAGIGLKSCLGWGVFLGCGAVTEVTVGLGLLGEALCDRQVPQCAAETCLGSCNTARPVALHGGDPP